MKSHSKRNCRGCYFSRLIGGKPLGGKLYCLRNSPAVDYDTGEARWPVVKKGDSCGQFRYRNENPIEKDRWPRGALPVYTDRFGDYCKIPLTQGRYAKVDPQDYIWLSQFRWHCKTNTNAVYAVRTITVNGRSKRIFMHRIIARTPPHLVCDHINHDGLDNRKANLRNCTVTQNNANSRSAASSSSKYKGVSWSKSKKRWAAYIKKDGKQFFLGHFDNEVEAAKEYDKAAKKFHKEYAALNFPE